MINTLIEHVPIKLRKSAVVASASASISVTTADVEDADELDGSEEEDSETDLLDEEEDEATLLISSDEEAELEAQRIRFHELLRENLLSSTCRDGKEVANSLNTAALRDEKRKQGKLPEKQKSKQQPPQQQKSQKQKQQQQQKQELQLQIQQQQAQTRKHEKQSNRQQEQEQEQIPLQLQKKRQTQETREQQKLIQTKQKELKAQQEKQKVDKESNKETERVINTNTDELNNTKAVAVNNARRRCHTGSNYSDNSQGSLILEATNESESCGIIYLHRDQQKLTFNCSLCNLHYDDVHVLSKHFYEMHKLFDEELNVAAAPQRKSARQLAKSTINELDVKTELATAGEDHLDLAIPMQQSNGCRSLESCGCVCVVKRKEIMFTCGFCDCKFSSVSLVEKHLEQHHDVFANMKPSSETEPELLKPKSELKTEVFISTELPVDDSTEISQPECNGATPPPPVIMSEPITDQPEEAVIASTDLLVVLPAPTPETPPPEEDELEKRNLKQLHGEERVNELNPNAQQQSEEQQPSELLMVSQASPQEQKINKNGNTKVSVGNPRRQRTKDKTTGSKRTYKRKIDTDLMNVTVEKKRNRNRIAAGKMNIEEAEMSNTDKRVRRRSATQKSYKDFFVDQQLPVSPESDTSNSFSPSSSPQITINCDLSRSVSSAEKSPMASTIEGGSMSFDSSQLRFPCNQCSKSFHKASRLAEHKRLHTGEKPFGCDECGKRFRIKMRLTEHKLRHRKVKAYKCEKCGMGVATRQDLTQHQRHHNDDRRYQCSQCPKAFVRSSDLKIHVRVHTGEKPYVCEICQKSFRANQNLIVHRRSHSTEKNYKCDYCDKRFRRNIDRKVHHRTHTGEKPYKCEICQRAYSSRAHVRGHIEREHIPDADGTMPMRRRPGPKPRRGKEDLTKQKPLVDELQGQQQQQQQPEKQPEQMKNNQKKHERNETKSLKAAEKNLEVNTSFNSSPIPFTLRENIEPGLSSPVQRAVGMGGSVGVGVGGVQQVSVTVSMQVESVANSHLLPAEKENNKSLLAKSKGSNSSVSKEHKITSYFAVLGRKAEI